MMTHDELMKNWETDSLIDKSSLSHTMSGHPMLHSKYLTILQTYKLSLRKHIMKYQRLKLLKQRYFNGELTKEELDANGWVQYLFKKPIRSEMENLLDADPDLQLIQEQSIYLETLISSTESIMKDINSRYFLFKSLVEYEKFLSGV